MKNEANPTKMPKLTSQVRYAQHALWLRQYPMIMFRLSSTMRKWTP